MRLKLLSLSVMAIGAGTLSAQAFASGYNFGSQSVSSQGSAHANAAEAADPSTIYYNPAGLTELEGDQIQVGVTSVVPSSSYSDSGSSRNLSSLTHLTLTGSNGGKYVPSSVEAPTFYMSHKINDRWTAGFGMFVPYGASQNYGDDWIGRYSVENIKLQAVNFNPSIAFKLDEHHSFGLGVSAQYMKAHLTKAVDATTFAAAQGRLSSGDGQASFAADGWGYGFNLGYLYKLDEHTRFGLAYRSKIHYTLKGTANWDFSAVSNSIVQAQLSALHPNSSASTDVTTPASASASFYHDLTPTIAVMGNVTWTEHSDMDQLLINFNGVSEKPMLITQNWKNSWLYALGMNYKYSDKLLLRSGIAYDKSPVNATYAHPALPDADRYWLSLGAKYKFDKNNAIDVSYSYVWFKNASMNYSDVCSGSTSCAYTGNGETTKGTFKTHLQLIGLAYTYSF